MRLLRLWLTDFRSYESAELAPAPGLTAIVGANGKGKSNLLEAVAWLATLGSFRGSPNEALVRVGAAEAVVRAEVEGDDPGGRVVLLDVSAGGAEFRMELPVQVSASTPQPALDERAAEAVS